MESYIRQKNLERFRDLLRTSTDEEQRNQLKRLIAVQEAKDVPAGPAPAPER